MKRSKLVNLMSVSLLGVFLCLFTVSIVIEHSFDSSVYVFALGLLSLVYGIIRTTDGTSDEIKLVKDFYAEVLALISAATITYYLSIAIASNVIAAGAIGVISALVLGKLNKENLILPAYCGTFVGMSALGILPNGLYVLAAGLVSGIVFIFSKNSMKGVGGRLGLFAFVGVAISVFLLRAAT